MLKQPLENWRRTRLLEIKRQALFGAVEPHEMRRHTLDGFVVAACEVAHFGPFDLDHARTEVCKLTRSKRSGHRMLQSDYRNAIEGSHSRERDKAAHI